MSGAILVLALLPGQSVTLPVQHRGEVTAQLELWVPPRGAGPGRGRVRLRLTVEGPAKMEVDALRLEDALAAWRMPWQISSWAEDGGARQELTFELEQVKPGRAQLPGLRLRVRGGPSQAWEELGWPDLLHEPRNVPDVIRLDPPPLSPWPARLRLAALLLAVVMALGWLVRLRKRWKRHLPPQPAHVRALAGIDEALAAGDGLPRLDGVLRGFLEEAGIPASRLTAAELLATVRERPEVSADVLAGLAGLLEQVDRAKFAGESPDVKGLLQSGEAARRLVAALTVGQDQRGRENRRDGGGG